MKNKGERAVRGWVLALCVAGIVWFSQDCMLAAQQAASVFATGVMPALFPLMVLAGLPGRVGPAGHSKEGRKGRPGIGPWLEAIAFGMAAGSPAGTRRVVALVAEGRIREGRQAPLLVAVGVMSPLFFVGTLARWTGNARGMALALGCHWLGALLAGAMAWALLGRNRRPEEQAPSLSAAPLACPPSVTTMQNPIPSISQALPEAIGSAARSLLGVCGAMMLFSVAAAVLRGVLLRLWPAWAQGNEPLLALVHTLLEVGGGTHGLVQAWQETKEGLVPLLCGACSFGGLSIWMQNVSFAKESIRPASLLFWRAVHAVLAYGCCFLALRLWPEAAMTSGFWGSQALVKLDAVMPETLPAYLGGLLLLAVLASLWQRSKIC